MATSLVISTTLMLVSHGILYSVVAVEGACWRLSDMSLTIGDSPDLLGIKTRGPKL